MTAGLLLRLEVTADSGEIHEVYLDVSGPVLLTPDGLARPGCTKLTTSVGTVCVNMSLRTLAAEIHQHRGAR